MRLNDTMSSMQGGVIMGGSREAEEKRVKWRKENTTNITMRLSNEKDADILELLNNSTSKVEVIRAALRLYMEQNEKDSK